jgi:alpha,alpha-trehalase
LSNMVHELLTADVLDSTAKSDLLSRALPTLEREYAFWMSERSVKLQGGHLLNRYFQGNSSASPRPESYSEDVKTAAGNTTIYSEIRAGAESGWDFSSREWLPRNGSLVANDLSKLGLADNQITRIVPVELNAYLYNMERQLGAMSMQQGNTSSSDMYYGAAARRAQSMQAVMWDGSSSLWRDVVIGDQVLQQSPSVTAACFIPLWAGSQFLKDSNNTASADAFLNSLQQSNLTGPGGIMTSTYNSGEQWDKPNVWPPLQWLVVEGMRALGSAAAVQKADQLAKDWLSGVYKAWLKDGVMHEKYNGLIAGVYGTGGEYSAQVGFGWTNGVTLDWIRRYYSTIGNSTANNSTTST